MLPQLLPAVSYLSDSPHPAHGMQGRNTGIEKEFVKHSHRYSEESVWVLPILSEEQVMVQNGLKSRIGLDIHAESQLLNLFPVWPSDT